MKSKLLKNAIDGEGKDIPGMYEFHCPGCAKSHHVWTGQAQQFRHTWQFNGNFDSPTFSPSLLIDQSKPERRCHFFIENGHIKYLDDCHHGLRGKIVPMEKI